MANVVNPTTVALDPARRLVVSVVPGKQTAEKVEVLVEPRSTTSSSEPAASR